LTPGVENAPHSTPGFNRTEGFGVKLSGKGPTGLFNQAATLGHFENRAPVLSVEQRASGTRENVI
jgi:hypothetical protein